MIDMTFTNQGYCYKNALLKSYQPTAFFSRSFWLADSKNSREMTIANILFCVYFFLFTISLKHICLMSHDYA